MAVWLGETRVWLPVESTDPPLAGEACIYSSFSDWELLF